MDLNRLGLKCKYLRENLGITQKEVAKELGCSPELISAFEHGRTNNAIILMWYVKRGLYHAENI